MDPFYGGPNGDDAILEPPPIDKLVAVYGTQL